MSKRTEKALNEKLNVKLPENLSKDNMILQLKNVQQNEKIVEMPKKKNTVKRLVPIAASLAVVVGLLSLYFGMGLGDKAEGPAYSDNTSGSNKIEVMRYQSYDKIYDKFDELRKEYEEDKNRNFWQNIFNYGFYTDDAPAENMAGDMNTGSTEEIAPGSSDDEAWGDGSSTGSAPSTETTQQKNHGTTNTQEEGVDEGDIIKTDGNYLYIANGGGKEVSIVDVTGGEMKEISQIDIEKEKVVEELYITEDRMIVVGFVYPDGSDFNVTDDGYVNATTYGNTEYETFVKVYDIFDCENPELITEYTQQGDYDSSRMLGTNIYCVSTYFVDVTSNDYRNYCIPEVETNGVCEKVAADCIWAVEESNSRTYAVITVLDVEDGTEPSSEAILGNCDELYASAKGLFISETVYNDKSCEELTKIYRFEYTGTGVDYKCMGRVAGYINNQFSMSYDGEYFRIATTLNKTELFDYGSSSDTAISMSIDDRVNNLYILNNNMQVVGKVEDLAQGETIESVRFVGNMAYVVTFRQTDPLFVIDLSDPANPMVKGELKIPGFSEYLHPIADGLLVGVGQDGTATSTNGDCKVSLFDVSNPYEPKETSVVRVTEGEAFCYTQLAENHKFYITLSDTEFAVPFSVRWFVHCGEKGRERGCYYIRYKLENNELCEAARYYVGDEESTVMGATYVEDIFYVVTFRYGDGTYVTAFDLNTNEEIGKVKTGSWE